ncbi:ABC transporter substrate-binding protein [Methylobacterium organophilum]|uniref:Leucine-binding protein domain-containing protein n=1 Tax=Methylobacterium organophilum TaxID=410 RepID=A0ABQ4TGD1_METOR|nr:ABC transporter substrate-binding protein [Methylobacterium organophilum]GJE29379.1 hypothetical protein LKMONMHP_4260 [Methylobacterium organophilum]
MSASAPIPIGSLVPLTGASSADGIEFRNGLILASEEINAAGGILGRPVAPVFVDTGRQNAEAVMAGAQVLIHLHRVHAIICGYNIGPQNSEYEPIADAGILYIHHNTLLQHHDTVTSNPERYFGCFMSDPAEYWYGQGFIKFISWLRETGQWRPASNRIAIISGSAPYSIVIANAMAAAAPQFGWEICCGPKVVRTPRTDWSQALSLLRDSRPDVIANTHFFAGDLAAFHQQFMRAPIPALVYLQYGAMHEAFTAATGRSAEGIIVGTVVGLLPDAMGNAFAQRYRARFGASSTPSVGAQTYVALHHYAIAAALEGGTAPPGHFEQNRRVAARLRRTIYRSVVGTIRYDVATQSAIPYPNVVSDPSLGMPHLFFQIQDHTADQVLIAPDPYRTGAFRLPSWMS